MQVSQCRFWACPLDAEAAALQAVMGGTGEGGKKDEFPESK